jgi:hypothetical protein
LRRSVEVTEAPGTQAGGWRRAAHRQEGPRREPILIPRDREPARTTDGAHAIAIDRQAVVSGFDYRAAAEGSSALLQLLGTANGHVRLPRVTIKD